MPDSPFQLDEDKLAQNIRKARRGAAPGPSGMTNICLLESEDDLSLFQQIGDAVERATSPFQHALETRAGCECVSHMFQKLLDLDPRATILSVDGVGALSILSPETPWWLGCLTWKKGTSYFRS